MDLTITTKFNLRDRVRNKLDNKQYTVTGIKFSTFTNSKVNLLQYELSDDYNYKFVVAERALERV